VKRSLLVGALAALLTLGAAAESAMAQAKKPGAAKPGGYVSATAPESQPAGPEAAPAAPTGELALGTVRLPKAVLADGKPLKPGTYQVRLTPQEASQPAVGQTPSYERWVEFLQGGQVKGREVVSIVPQSDISKVAKGTPPPQGRAKIEGLKGDDYLRVWINRGGNHFLIHLVQGTGTPS
jgi:hypothetical protein